MALEESEIAVEPHTKQAYSAVKAKKAKGGKGKAFKHFKKAQRKKEGQTRRKKS